jgi:hypothetical protein
MRPVALLVVSLARFASMSCIDEQVSRTTGVEEPIVVESGQFIAGALPGLPEPPASADAGASVSPLVSDVEISTSAVAPGTDGMAFAGHASPGSQTVAVRFADAGSGYWVVPVAGPDQSANNFLTWQFAADFSHVLAPGLHTLLFAAIDASGRSGTQFDLPFCIDTPVPDNFNVCSPKRPPPAAVLSLSWSTAVDLDLIVQTPSGATVGGKNATTARAGDAGLSGSAAGAGSNGVLDHDSNRNCAIDGIDREDVVWQGPPASGVYQVWVDMFSACGKAAANFTVSLWLAESRADGGQQLVMQQPPVAIGELLADEANGGSSRGLFVGKFILQ